MMTLSTLKANRFYGWLLTATLALSAITASAVVPTITAVAPASGVPVTGSVTITGTGFNDTAGRNVVWFGNMKGTVTGASATSLNVTVPVGARYSEITVLNLTTRLSAKSQAVFAPDYDNSCLVAGSQTFKPRVDFTITGTANPDPWHTAIGDIDGDGNADLIVCTYDIYSNPFGYLYIYRNSGNQGSISFESPVLVPTGGGAFQVKLADLDGDGKLDIITASSGTNRIAYLRNKSTPGNISFPAYNSGSSSFLSHGASDVTIADFDGDGKLDIAGCVYQDNMVEIFRNTLTSIPTNGFPSNSFTFYHIDLPTGFTPVSLCSADMDGDNKPDIVTSNATDGSISVFRNISSVDTFVFESNVDYPAGTTCSQVRLVDLNGDNKPEIIVTNKGSDDIAIFQNNVISTPFDGSSFTSVNLSTGAGTQPAAVDFGDLDGDGKTDIAVSLGNGNAVAIYKNTYSGGAITASAFTLGSTLSTGAASGPAGVTVGDIDGDTKPDIVVGNIGTDNVSIFKNTAVPDTVSITGTDSVCVAAAITLTNAHCTNEQVYWSVSNATATIVGGSGAADVNAVITGITAGVDTLTATVVSLYDTSYVHYIIRVLPIGDTGTITGASNVCVGSLITLTETVTGGTWGSTVPAAATVSGGVVTGLAAGTTVITYTVSSLSCGSLSAHHLVNVNALPNAGTISGPGGVCTGSSISLTASVAGGNWYNRYPLIAAAIPAGTTNNITGLAVGTDTILYVVTTPLCGSDTAIKSVGVVTTGISLPITGADSVCNGATITLANGAAGGTWSTLGTAILSVNASSGAVTGLSVGTATVTYTVTYGCGPIVSYKDITVKAIPNAGSITGPDSVCRGATISLTTTGSGGVWSSSATSTATVSATGVVGGASATLATATITYTSSTFSCGNQTVTHDVTVKPLANAGTIVGLDSVCSGAVITLTNPTASVGTWSSLSTAIATVNAAGGVGGVSVGLATTTITYTASSFSCGSATATHAVTVKPLPNAGSITGPDSVCRGATISLTTTGSGGVWSSSATGVATVSATGVVGGASATLATATISYMSSTFSCGNQTATHDVTVKPLPNAGTIVGLDSVCSGAVITLTNPTAGVGTWSSLSTAIATVNAAGGVGGVSVGLATTTITYTASTFSCGSATATHAVTVKPLPNAGTITGPTSVCSGTTISLNASAPGGTWSNAATATATVSGSGTTGTVGGASPTLASTTISYTVSTFSCGSASATQLITVNPQPDAGSIAGLSTVCEQSNITLTDAATGGTWSSTNTAAATVAGGVVGGVAAGNSTISYTVTNICGSVAATLSVVVNPLPVAGIISGATTTVCEGSIIIYTDPAPGGTWASGNTGVATVTGGTVGGVAAGNTLISYTVTNSCGTAFDTIEVNVNPLPHAGAISGTSSVCEGSSVSLTVSATGGTWGTSSPSTATVTTDGVVGGGIAGPVTISYTVTNSCGTDIATYPFTVNPLPHAGTISGVPNLCPGTTTVLSSTTTGGVWSVSPTSVATITAGGVAGGVTPGNATVRYVYTNVCGSDTSTFPITVIAYPVAGTLSGPSLLCPGATISLSSTVTGGTWSTLTPTVATVVAATGVTGGVGPGTATIRYTVTNFCGSASATKSVTVNPIVVPSVTLTITPNDTICAGTAITFTATAVNGGLTPTFTWTNFGSYIGSGNPFVYTPDNGDNITVTLTSSAPCPVPPTATAPATSFLVYPVVTPVVTITSSVPGDVISYWGQLVTFFANATYGGTNPTFQWYLDGVLVAGATSSTFTTSVESPDTVYCIMTSDLECVTTNIDTSNIKIITTGTLGINSLAGTIDEVNIYPNPNNGSFTISGTVSSTGNTSVEFMVTDMLGKTVFTDRADAMNGAFKHSLKLGGNIPPGNYLVRIVKDNDVRTVRFTLND